MLSINIDPILISLGPLQIRYYGLIFALAFIVILIVLLRAVKKGRIELKKEQAYDLIFYLLVGIIIGARLFHVIFWGYDYYSADPIKILYIWQGGVSFHGGLVGALIAAWLFTKKNKVSFFKLADIIVLPAIFMLALGRMANFINQELLGTITDLPWCIQFLRADPLNCRHPVQLYAAFGRFSLFFYLINFTKNYKPGFIFWKFVLLISIGRLGLDFLREDIRYLALSSGQWLSILLIIISTIILWRSYREDLRRLFRLSKKQAARN